MTKSRWLLGGVVFIAIASQTAFTQSGAPDALHRASSREHAPAHLCHEAFSLATSRTFEFVVPANVLSPRLTGMLAASTSKVEVMLLNQAQYDDFLKGQPGDAVFDNEIKSGNLDITLNSASVKDQKYYLVLNNSTRHSQTVWADFSLKFD